MTTRPRTTDQGDTVADKPTPGTAVARFDPSTSKYPILFGGEDGGDFAQLIADNFGDEGFSPSDLDKVTLPTGGDTYWRLPDEPPAQNIRGVVVFWGTTRSYWKVGLDDAEDTTPPDCASADGRLGNGEYGPGSVGNPTGQCATCPMNQWESGKGNSKACKEQRRLWMLLQGQVLPVEVQLPPTSIKDFKKYMARLTGKGLPYFGVETVLALKAVKMGSNNVAVVDPSRGDELAPEERAAAQAYGQTIRTYLQNAARVEPDRSPDAARSGPAGPGGANDPFADDIPQEYADQA